MLAKRVIPTLLCRGRTLVKGSQFDSWRSVGLAAQGVRIHQAREVDELVLLDISATHENRGPDLALVAELAAACFMPLAVGGGVRTFEDVRALLAAGADKVVIGTSAYIDPHFMTTLCHRVGSQAIMAAVDVRDGKVWIRSGTHQTLTTPARYAKILEQVGVGEILLTAIDREGTMKGYDLDLVREVANTVDIPVIANGGAGSYEDMANAIRAGASAAAAGALFQFTDCTPTGAAEYLAGQGIEARLPKEETSAD